MFDMNTGLRQNLLTLQFNKFAAFKNNGTNVRSKRSYQPVCLIKIFRRWQGNGSCERPRFGKVGNDLKMVTLTDGAVAWGMSGAITAQA